MKEEKIILILAIVLVASIPIYFMISALFGTLLLTPPAVDASTSLIIQNNNQQVAAFANTGDIILNGNCNVMSLCNPPADSYAITNDAGDVVSYINPSGDLCIETGNCAGGSSSCSAQNNALTITSNSGTPVITIDNSGDLCLTGILYANNIVSPITNPPNNPIPCTPIWTAQNTSCTGSPPTKTQYWTDANNCDIETGRPANQTFSCSLSSCSQYWIQINEPCMPDDFRRTYYNNTNPSCTNLTGFPANSTVDCDYNNLGFIGSLSEIEKENINSVNVLVDGQDYSSTGSYTGVKLIKIKDGTTGTEIVSFSHNFISPINFRNIKIKRQGTSSSFGYTIVSGISEEKTIAVDKKNSSSTKVCVKDIEISSISGISTSCNGASETLLSCPGSGSGFTCSISGSFFFAGGVRNSGVKEFIQTSGTDGGGGGGGSGGSCMPSWTCSGWSSCVNRQQTQTCTDSNNCNTTTNRPALTQTCTIWEGTNTGDGSGTGVTTTKPSKVLIISLIAVGVFSVLFVVVVMIILLKKGKEKKKFTQPPFSRIIQGNRNIYR